jgi:hypothetical protein
MWNADCEAELVSVCERMGYGLKINSSRHYVEVNTVKNSLRRQDRHRFSSITHALIWVEARELSGH